MKHRTLWISLILSFIAAGEAFGQEGKPTAVEQTPWKLAEGHIYGGNSIVSGARMMDPVVMDFDGDGVDDIVFGTPGMSPNGVSSAGSIYVILGQKDRDLTGRLDSTGWRSFDYRFDGHTRNGQLGLMLATGDFNGDGKVDFAAAEPGQTGAVYVFYGGKKREKGIYDVRQSGASDVSFVTSEANSNLGVSMCVGDFNHDGIDDLALAHVARNNNTASNASLVTMLTMRKEWDKQTYDIGGKIYGKTVISRPVSGNIRVVHSCAAGDFNDDGLMDIALGMPLDSYQGQKGAGSVTLIYQPFKYNGTVIDIGKVDEKTGIRISGDQANAQFGYSLAAADFTGDGRDDLAISAPERLVNGPDNEGAIYIMDNNERPEVSGSQPKMLQITGKGGSFGFRLKAEDVNGDKRQDLVVMAPKSGRQGDGSVSAWLGGPHFVESLEQSGRADIEVDGAEFMNFGLGASFGDFNGDGKVDGVVRVGADPLNRDFTGTLVVLGNIAEYPALSTISENFFTILAPSQGGGLSASPKRVKYGDKTYQAWFSPMGAGNRSIICLIDESKSGTSNIALASTDSCDIQILGPEKYEISDFSITTSPLGKSLLSIGVPDMPVKTGTGFVAVIQLPDDLSKPLALNLNENTLASSARTYYLSNEDNGGLGGKIEWRDLDGDGYEDLIIGASKRMVDSDMSGSVFIVKGKAEQSTGLFDLNETDSIRFEGFMDEQFGSQWQILDMNQDGELDLAVRAAHAVDASGEEYATIYVIYSVGHKSDKIYGVKSPELGALRILSPQNYAGLDIIPQSVDINGDGYNDLVLLSPDYRAGLQRQGKVIVVYASGDFKGGELKLSSESHIGFSFSPGRNERIVDTRFVKMPSAMNFVVVTSDLVTGLNHTLSSFVDRDANIFHGQYVASQLKRTISDARMPIPTRLIVIPNDGEQQDEFWLLFPYDGMSQSGQGVARKVVPWE